MLRMPELQVHLPATAQEAVHLRSTLPESMYVAGGTDLLPNLKHHLHAPQHLISLAQVAALGTITESEAGGLRIGATAPLHDVATSALVQRSAPGLAEAAAVVGGPQHRRMGTLGGNVMLDTRCLFYNQTRHWRASLGYCLKREGVWCHVIGSAKACVAAQSSDTVPMLTALGAELHAVLPDGEATVPLADLFRADGRYERNHTLPAEALVRAIAVPAQPSGHRSTYRKVRARASVDFPQLGVAVAAAFDGDACTALSVVLGALLPQPRVVKHLDRYLGSPLTDDAVDAVAEHAFKQARPVTSVHGDPAWRRLRARVEVARALRSLRP